MHPETTYEHDPRLPVIVLEGRAVKQADDCRARTGRMMAVGAVVLTCWTGTLSGCAARQVREVAFSKPDVTVLLRGTRSGGEWVDRGFQHPTEIAPEQLAAVLTRIRIRKRGEAGREATPLIRRAQLARVAAGLSAGLSAAGPGQEVVVLSTRAVTRLSVLRGEYLTSFTARVQGGNLHLQLGHVDWPVPVPRPERLPEPSPRRPVMEFDVVLGPGIERIASQTLRVSGSTLGFPSEAEAEITGLPRLESPQPSVSAIAPRVEPTPRDAALPPNPRTADPLEQLSPAELRAVATLREARERGELAQREYQLLLDALLRAEAR